MYSLQVTFLRIVPYDYVSNAWHEMIGHRLLQKTNKAIPGRLDAFVVRRLDFLYSSTKEIDAKVHFMQFAF